MLEGATTPFVSKSPVQFSGPTSDTTSMCALCPVGILQNEIVEEYRKKIHGFDTRNNVFVH